MWVRFEITFGCVECGKERGLRALRRKTRCPRCEATQRLPVLFWEVLISRARLDRELRDGIRFHQTTEYDLDGPDVELLATDEGPGCPACRVPLEEVQGAEAEPALRCPRCGRTEQPVAAKEWLRRISCRLLGRERWSPEAVLAEGREHRRVRLSTTGSHPSFLVRFGRSGPVDPGRGAEEGPWPFEAGAGEYASRWGYEDHEGRIVIEPTWKIAGPFADGRALVADDGRTCCIDRSGGVVFEVEGQPTLAWGSGLQTTHRRFRGGLVVLPGGRHGPGPRLYDRDGRAVPWPGSTPPTRIGPLRDGRRRFTTGDRPHRHGFLDAGGQLAVEPRFSLADDFSEGLAAVSEVFSTPANQLQGYIDPQGSWAIPPRFRTATAFSDGLARVGDIDGEAFVDRRGEIVLRLGHRGGRCGDFREGLAPRERDVGGWRWGFIDRTGAWVIEPRFLWAEPFSEGLAPAREEGVCGFIDRSGAWAIEPRFTHVEGFREGRAWAAARLTGFGRYDLARTRAGFIDREGRWLSSEIIDEDSPALR